MSRAKTCERCRIRYIPHPSRASRQRYCSPRCYQMTRRTRPWLVCRGADCDAEFLRMRPEQVFCSPRCGRRWQRRPERIAS